MSEAALRVVAGANDEAARLRHQYIGTEHVMLALCAQDADGSPLRALAVDPQRASTMIREIIRLGNDAPVPGSVRPLTSRTKTALELAAESARRMGESHVGVAHVLVGLMRERMNIAAQILAQQGLTAERAEEHARHAGGPSPS